MLFTTGLTRPTAKYQGNHRKLVLSVSVLASHRKRFAVFGIIGVAVFLLGIAMQLVLTGWWHMSAVASFVLQGVVSIEVSFLLNHFWTWRDRHTPFWRACARFNAQRVLASIGNLIVYWILITLGINYLIANLLTTAVFTLINYVASNGWVFTSIRRPQLEPPPADAVPPVPSGRPVTETFPTVSVIIPCKNNAGTICATVESLLQQDYPALEEVILVGSTRDSTWTALHGITDPRLILLEQEPAPGRREPNDKRDMGLRKASGEILALMDSDIVMDPDWLTLAIPRLITQGGGVIAGGMKSIQDTFWGRFVDRNVLAAKTPRVPNSYLVTARNFGRRRTRPPITANAVFSRNVYESCPLDVTWAYGYEDYEWFWRVAQAGYPIKFAGDINGAHHHRRRFRDLVTEYRCSAEGCSRFIQRHPDSPLAAKRRRQGIILPVVAVAGVAAVVLLASAGMLLPMTVATALVTVALMGREIIAARHLEAAVYPYAGLVLAVVFTLTLTANLLRWNGPTATAPVWDDTPVRDFDTPVRDFTS